MHRRREVVDDLDELLGVLPPHIKSALDKLADLHQLIEIVLDLGRPAEARFPQRFVYLGEEPVTRESIEYVVKRVGAFGTDNRAGIERTLHRISAIRNRQGEVIGLTCRIGRAVFGTIDIIRDVVESGRSILLLGRPGVGKTTMLRETARVLADDLKKRVIVVDTSNEIAGDGDVPHPAIGRARRMQVPRVEDQAAVMIEAVENHMPEVIVIDEIGTEEEAAAARTIAERGVQLIGTAHGNTLENLILNPTLSDLIGGIHAVTLSDEEARKRGTQKTVLERKSPPTFDVLIEIQDKDQLAIHQDVAATVDRWLRAVPAVPEVRRRTPDGKIEVVQEAALAALPETRARRRSGVPERRLDPWADGWGGAREPARGAHPGEQARGRSGGLVLRGWRGPEPPGVTGPAGPWNGLGNPRARAEYDEEAEPPWAASAAPRTPWGRTRTVTIYPYAVSKNRLERAVAELRAPVLLARDLQEADMVLTLKGQYRKMPKKLKEAERRGIPVHIIRSNTVTQMVAFLERFIGDDPAASALLEAERGVAWVKSRGEAFDLGPQPAHLRKLQHELIERYQLQSTSIGEEPDRRVRILPEQTV